ncbi:MAG TPA: SPOR domain-containing protein [Tenuifilaceae bacterium]|nr:SPOR domain-containing protein [Tenuifilaceae bacterium]
MLKFFTILVNTIALTIFSIFFGNEVSLTVSTPRNVSAGTSFDVEVILNKSTVNGFARFQQTLPLGLTAELVEASNADFSFDDQNIKLVWLRLPDQKQIKIIYRVKVDERLKGNFTLNGLFSYIDNNERKSTSTKTENITITPSSRIDPNLIVDINEFQNIVPVQAPVSLLASNVRCIRQTPVPIGEANDQLVELLVNKGNAQKFAKIEENIPTGYSAEAIETKDAIFSFKDQKAKFLWMNLPQEPRFMVSYRLIPENGQGEATVTITGTFSYVIGDATRTLNIIQKDVELKNLDSKEIESLLATTITSYENPEGISSTFTQVNNDGGIDIPVKYQKIEDKPKKIVKKQPDMLAYMLTPEKGIYYRIQIAAGHHSINIKKYFERLNVSYDVRTEKHEGWYKYSIGSFKEYKGARDFRILIWNTTKINDAFVAAYNNGRRITVQEALMITNQQWYR